MLLRVGFAAHDITPPLGLPLGGYGARVGGATGVTDPLFCRVLTLDDGATPLAIVVLDLVQVSGPWVEAVRQRAAETLGIPRERLLVAATHTHAGPAVFRSALAENSRLASYEDSLVGTILSCLTAARQGAVAAELRIGRAAVQGVAANRRDPSVAVDEDVRALCAVNPGGRLLGVLANFGCHPTVLSAANYAYSADLFGAAVAVASRAVGAPVVLSNGAAGDVSTRFTRRAQTCAEVERLGGALAAALSAAVRNAAPVRSEFLAAATARVPVRWQPLPTPADATAHLDAALAALQAQRTHGSDPAVLRLAQSRVEGAQLQLWLSSRGGWETLFGQREPVAGVQALRCGDLAILAAPGELFSSAAQELRRTLGADTLVVGYANDYLGYFVPEEAAHDGGYEALIAMVDPACEPAIRDGLLDVAMATRREPPGVMNR